MENQTALKWHQNPSSIILLLVFFFPLGLYFMWKNGVWSSKVRWGVTALFFVLLVGSVKQEKENTSLDNYEIYQAKNYEQAIALVDKKIIEYTKEYNELCGRPRNDQLKEKFRYLRTDIQALWTSGSTCENLSTEDQLKIDRYAQSKINENNVLKELDAGNIVCW